MTVHSTLSANLGGGQALQPKINSSFLGKLMVTAGLNDLMINKTQSLKGAVSLWLTVTQTQD